MRNFTNRRAAEKQRLPQRNCVILRNIQVDMQKSFLYQAATISYTILGKGKPVLLLHGFGEDSNVWKYQVSFLKEHCLLIIPDLPGSGKSSLLGLETGVRRLELNDYISIDDYADCIHALLQHENIRSCIMLGHSMGGYITLAFAEKYASLLTGFGLVHSTAYADSEEKKLGREKGIATIEKYGSYPFLKNTIPNLFSKRFKETHPEKVNELIEANKEFSKEALQQYYRAMMLRPDRTNVFLSNRFPVLFVMGTEDVAAPLEDVIKQASLPYISYIYVLQDTAHMGMWEAPEKMNQQLLFFINS
jgi:pimeloyl-ACP methyl ester carboxylesterase